MASGSIAQVHKAVLRGEVVAVKVSPVLPSVHRTLVWFIGLFLVLFTGYRDNS